MDSTGSVLLGNVSKTGISTIVVIRFIVLVSAEFKWVREMYTRMNGGRIPIVPQMLGRIASRLRSGFSGHTSALSDFSDMIELMDMCHDNGDAAA
jgi:hypothetical protein